MTTGVAVKSFVSVFIRLRPGFAGHWCPLQASLRAFLYPFGFASQLARLGDSSMASPSGRVKKPAGGFEVARKNPGNIGPRGLRAAIGRARSTFRPANFANPHRRYSPIRLPSTLKAGIMLPAVAVMMVLTACELGGAVRETASDSVSARPVAAESAQVPGPEGAVEPSPTPTSTATSGPHPESCCNGDVGLKPHLHANASHADTSTHGNHPSNGDTDADADCHPNPPAHPYRNSAAPAHLHSSPTTPTHLHPGSNRAEFWSKF